MNFLNPDKDWIDVLAAFGPVIIGLAIVYVAVRQWLTSKTQAKQQHQEKYIKVWEILRVPVIEFRGTLEVTPVMLQEIIDARTLAKFTLNKEIVEFIGNYLKDAGDYFNLDLKFKGKKFKDSAEKNEWREELNKIRNRMFDVETVEFFSEKMK